jgi:hypothetical protein
MIAKDVLPNFKLLSMIQLGETHYKIWEKLDNWAVSAESSYCMEIFHFDSYKAAEAKYVSLTKQNSGH